MTHPQISLSGISALVMLRHFPDAVTHSFFAGPTQVKLMPASKIYPGDKVEIEQPDLKF